LEKKKEKEEEREKQKLEVENEKRRLKEENEKQKLDEGPPVKREVIDSEVESARKKIIKFLRDRFVNKEYDPLSLKIILQYIQRENFPKDKKDILFQKLVGEPELEITSNRKFMYQRHSTQKKSKQDLLDFFDRLEKISPCAGVDEDYLKKFLKLTEFVIKDLVDSGILIRVQDSEYWNKFTLHKLSEIEDNPMEPVEEKLRNFWKEKTGITLLLEHGKVVPSSERFVPLKKKRVRNATIETTIHDNKHVLHMLRLYNIDEN